MGMVTVTVVPLPSTLSIVSDQGIGIPADDMPCVFEPFHRSGNVGDVPGSGLGLAITQRCAELHRGKLKLDPERHTCHWDNKAVTLTVTEFLILQAPTPTARTDCLAVSCRSASLR